MDIKLTEFKSLIENFRQEGSQYYGMSLVADMTCASEELGVMAPFLTLATVLGLFLAPFFVFIPQINIIELTSLAAAIVLSQIFLWMLGLGWTALLARGLCSSVIHGQDESPFIHRLKSLWSEYSPVEEKSGKYKKLIIDADENTKISPEVVITISHRLRTWIKLKEREREILMQEKKKVDEYYSSINNEEK